MGLFADGFKELKKASEPLYKAPKSIQQTIEIMKVAENGIFEVAKNRFSKCYRFQDINYTTTNETEQIDIFERYCKFLNSLDVSFKITVNNKNKDMEQYDRKGRIQALENARDKATYMVQTYNGTLGSPKSIDDGNMPIVTSPMIQPRMFKSAAITEMADEAGNFDAGSGTLESLDTFPVIRKTYTVNVVFDVNY